MSKCCVFISVFVYNMSQIILEWSFYIEAVAISYIYNGCLHAFRKQIEVMLTYCTVNPLYSLLVSPYIVDGNPMMTVMIMMWFGAKPFN